MQRVAARMLQHLAISVSVVSSRRREFPRSACANSALSNFRIHLGQQSKQNAQIRQMMLLKMNTDSLPHK